MVLVMSIDLGHGRSWSAIGEGCMCWSRAAKASGWVRRDTRCDLYDKNRTDGNVVGPCPATHVDQTCFRHFLVTACVSTNPVQQFTDEGGNDNDEPGPAQR